MVRDRRLAEISANVPWAREEGPTNPAGTDLSCGISATASITRRHRGDHRPYSSRTFGSPQLVSPGLSFDVMTASPETWSGLTTPCEHASDFTCELARCCGVAVGYSAHALGSTLMARWSRRRPVRSRRTLLEDSEAFLGGRLVEVLQARGEQVPTWAWTNVLADGSTEQLRTAGQESVSARRPYRQWRDGRAGLARLMLDAPEFDGPRLLVQQRTALVPLELILADQPAPGISSAVGWVHQVERTLSLLDQAPIEDYVDIESMSHEEGWS